MEHALLAEGLSKHFGAVRALDSVDLQVEAGEVLALLGPNGAGKTTLVRILTTLLPPDSGKALVGGYDITRNAAAVRRNIGLSGQSAAVDGYLTASENLRMIARLSGLTAAAARRRTEELIGSFDLTSARDRLVRTYSGGMRRRLDLAAGLVARPAVLFLDEPTTGLDPRSRAAVWETLDGLTAAGTAVLLTTQYMDEADRLASRIALLDEGRVVATGTADQLKAEVGAELNRRPSLDEVFLTLTARRTT
jgi:daunorubicin resistance ABC transporter ATP-binding subunit